MLGTGAGRLNVMDVFEIFMQCFQEEKDINVHIFLGSQKDYLSLLERSKKEKYHIKNPRVFISYTGEDEENKKWVKDFVCKLRNNGVNAILDIYNLKLGDDLAQWMTNQLCMADKVILICDKYYAIKADARKGGVGWETMLIQGDMMMNSLTRKYIFIVREKDFDEGIPMYAKTKYSLQWTNREIQEEEFKKLLFYLFDCDLEPELGPIPDEILMKIKQQDKRGGAIE